MDPESANSFSPPFSHCSESDDGLEESPPHLSTPPPGHPRMSDDPQMQRNQQMPSDPPMQGFGPTQGYPPTHKNSGTYGYPHTPYFPPMPGYPPPHGYPYMEPYYHPSGQYQAYRSASPYPLTGTPGTAGNAPHFNAPPPNTEPRNPPVPQYPAPNYHSMDPRRFTPAHTLTNHLARPHFHPAGNMDHGEPGKDMQSPYTGMPATPPMSHTTYSAHPPPRPPPPPPILPPTGSPGAEIIIAVMGVTGTGKSYFIREVSGISDVEVSDDLHSCTAKVQPHSFPYAGAKITLIDTPGFNDTTKSDTEVLADICAWTSLNYRKGRLLSGIIYLHRITDVRMDGSSLKNLRMFQRLCGPGALRNVLLTTTQWSNVDQALGEFREDNLRHGDFWGGLISKGASLERFMGTRESGLELIHKLMANEPKALDIQDQMVQKNMTLVETNAGKFMNEELIALQKKYKENLENLERERQKAVKEKDDEMKEILAQEQERAREKLENAAAEKKLLADLHAAEMKKLEEAERRREEEREKNDRAVIAVAAKDISVMAHLKCMFTSYNTRGRLIYDIDDTREFVKNPFPVTINYQFTLLAGVEVCVKTIAEFFDAGMGVNNYISLNGGYYRCKGDSCIKRGSQKFIIFRRA